MRISPKIKGPITPLQEVSWNLNSFALNLILNLEISLFISISSDVMVMHKITFFNSQAIQGLESFRGHSDEVMH